MTDASEPGSSVAADGAPRVALVTGAAGRTGGAVVARLLGEGYAVAGIDLRPSAATMPVVADVTDRAAMAAAAGDVQARLGPVSVLVTAARVRDPAAFGTLDPGAWARLLAVHLGGTANACAAVLPAMLAAARGTVVTLASAEAAEGSGDAYRAAATGAVLGFSRSLAVEVAPAGVRLNCVAGGSPSVVADLVAFLAREGGFYVGQVFAPGRGGVA